MEDRNQNFAAITREAEGAFSAARKLKSEDAWKRAGVAAREAITICQNNTQGMSSREAIIEVVQQKEYWTEQANLADVKALATSPCADDWQEKIDRANAIMKMTREKLGSPISPAMKAFIANPSDVTLRAIGKSALIAMSAAEAEEALEGAGIFAKASTDAATLAKSKDWDVSIQESINLSASITSEVAEFARALAAFKRVQEVEEALPRRPPFVVHIAQTKKRTY